ncbi:hypothetical protein K504DRAFT_494192, partial [Pleomassaria siparia CBS 279.74]
MTRQRKMAHSVDITDATTTTTTTTNSEEKEEEDDDDDTSAKSKESHRSEGKPDRSKEKDSCIPPDVIFSFGPNGTCFYKLGHLWNFCLSTDTIKHVDSSNVRELFAAAVTEDGGFFMAYEDKNKIPVWQWVKGQAAQLNANHCNLFPLLSQHKAAPSLKLTTLTFGPFGSYFTRVDREINYSSSLSPSLVEEIQEKKLAANTINKERVYPAQVALGAGGAWAVIWSDESWSWSAGLNHRLMGYLRSEEPKEDAGQAPVFIALSPHNEDEFFLVLKNGHLLYSLRELSMESTQKLNRLSLGYMQSRAKKDGTTFFHQQSVGNVTKSITITPDTDFPVGFEKKHSPFERAEVRVDRPPVAVMRYKTMETWRRFQSSPFSRRENLVAMSTAGLCTATACRSVGLSKCDDGYSSSWRGCWHWSWLLGSGKQNEELKTMADWIRNFTMYSMAELCT